jgi:hypothetical protein
VSQVVSIALIVTAITTVFYAAGFAIGYYMMLRGNGEVVQEMREEHGTRCAPRGARRVLLLLGARSLRLPGSAAPLARRAEPLAPIQPLPYDDQWSSSLPFDWLTLGTNPLGRGWHLFLVGHQITEL